MFGVWAPCFFHTHDRKSLPVGVVPLGSTCEQECCVLGAPFPALPVCLETCPGIEGVTPGKLANPANQGSFVFVVCRAVLSAVLTRTFFSPECAPVYLLPESHPFREVCSQ